MRTGRALVISLATLLPAFAFAGTEKTVYAFAGGTGGAIPAAGLVPGAKGNLYGVTNSGGNNECNSLLSAGCGTVFELTPQRDGTWSESTIHVFSQSTDGGNPSATPVFDAAGSLFGSTQYYGPLASGTLWELTPSGGNWNESIPHTFTGGLDGFYCEGLTFNSAGQLIGTTFAGGINNDGTVFYLKSLGDNQWSDIILHNFAGNNDGNAPDAPIIFDGHGHVFGTTYEGGPHLTGTVYEMQRTASGVSEAPIYIFQGEAFGGGSDGANPVAAVVMDSEGNLYGTTDYGGSHSVGTVYELSPNGSGGWTEKVLYTFTDGADGGHPGALILDSAGNLYGTTSGHNTDGSVYELSPSAGGKWTFTLLYDFTGGDDGSSPSGPLVRDAKGNLYGTAAFGGASGLGVVFEITP